ncbi:MAG: hypothetical protein B6D77_08415 [gamma proteobacterium symbiont of Ctena orbiculata]|nr:MAG: hypothetical protein B6D77_08415 [gamma proteobacterium symbiont of Ctena orbiculata]PVV21884.1 MAG: hypothetical protein B6D78_06465 [gamma proteobacterium symbiont of Ctena orbiculata]
MNQHHILYPMIILVLFTGLVGIAMLVARYRAVREGSLRISYFKYNRGGKQPEYLLKINQHFDNLLETPLLFYLSLILILQQNRTDVAYIAMAWAYIASRFLHAWIHMGTNNILHRKNAFILSYVLIFTIWIRLFLQLLMDSQ